MRAEKARRTLREFIRQAWPVLNPLTEFESNWHIDAVAEHLEAVTAGQIRKLIINIPFRCSKSTLVSVMWPAWEWIDHPELSYLAISHSLGVATRDNTASRRLIESRWYRQNWGDRYKLTSDQNEKRRFKNDKGGERIATSIDSRITGEGSDRRILDDPHDASASQTQLKVATDAWDEKLASRLNDPRKAATVVIMQRIAEGDMTDHLVSEGGWELLKLPGHYEGEKNATGIGWSDPREHEGDVLWERWRDTYEQYRKSKPTVYASQIQQRPAPAEGLIFKRHWWRYWHRPGDHLPPVMVKKIEGDSVEVLEIKSVPLPTEFDEDLQSWDMAFKDTRDSAFVCGGLWSRKKADVFLRDIEKGKWDFIATVSAVRRLTAKYPQAAAKLVEDKANGPAVISALRHDIPGLIAIQPEGDKIARAHAVTPVCESGNVYLPHPAIAPWVTGFIEELATFPNSKYKDQVDMTTQALRRFAKRSQGGAYGAPTVGAKREWV